MRSRAHSLLLLLALAIAVLAAQPDAVARPRPVKPANYFPGAEWRRATPASQQVDAAMIAALVERLRADEIADIHSLLIVRNGYLVVKEYFDDWTPDQIHTQQSVTKSVTSLLVGAALQRRLLRSVDEPVLGFFPEYEPVGALDEWKQAMTVRDLLAMRTGLDWSEAGYTGTPLEQLNRCNCDWLRFMLDWPMAEPPGRRWEYNSGASILLGGVLRAATGKAVNDFAREALFIPLGIDDQRWSYGLPEGLMHTGGGLYLRPQSMARIGYLVLRNGRWGRQTIVSPQWLGQSMTRSTRTATYFAGRPVDYGLHWWLLPLPQQMVRRGVSPDVYVAAGRFDQWIFVAPRFDLVVVVTGGTDQTFAEPVDFLYDAILPAMR